jgi:hypothetical protein
MAAREQLIHTKRRFREYSVPLRKHSIRYFVQNFSSLGKDESVAVSNTVN